jgi:hypothetical protein
MKRKHRTTRRWTLWRRSAAPLRIDLTMDDILADLNEGAGEWHIAIPVSR